MSDTPKREYRQAREDIKQARHSLEQLREYKLRELREVECKLAGMNAVFGGKGSKA